MRSMLALFGALAGLLLTGCPTDVANDDDAGECNAFSGHDFPTVVIDAPDDGTNYTTGEAINFVVLITDADSDVTEIELVAEDTIDNTADPIDVDLPSPDDDGRAAFSMQYDDLGQGAHTVRITARDPDGCEEADSVLVCLDAPEICN